jgi:DNA (cytosine-5)-methyltransferase 1
MKKNHPVALELFSGCGGMTLGLKDAGFNVIGAVEVSALAVKTYKANHPEVFVWEKDIRKLDVGLVAEELGLRPGELDLLAGCPPCQGFSQMRTLNGARKIKDHRNSLVFQFIRFVKALQPKTIMMENTPALSTDWRMGRLLREFGKLGYTGECRLADTANYGVPQRRRRMILLAGRFGAVPFPDADATKKTVREVIAGLPKAGKSGDRLHDLPEHRTAKVVNLISRIPRDGGSRAALGKKNQLKCHRKCTGFKDIYGRMAWDKPSPTITSGCFNPSKGRFLHPEENRTITLREASLLQTFPLDYYFPPEAGKCAIAEMIGNALPPIFIKRHGDSVVCYLKRYKARKG